MHQHADQTRILQQQRQLRKTLVSLTDSRTGSHSNRNSSGENQFALLFRFLTQFELLARSLYRLRAASTTGPLRSDTEELIASASRDLLVFQADSNQKNPEDSLFYRYRRTWRENIPLFLYTLAMFVVASIVGWNIGISGYDYSALLIPQPLIEKILDHDKWFHAIQDDPLVYGFSIASNNIRVAINCFTLSALAGLGGVYILGFNGLFFGAILGFCQANRFDEALLNFVVGHGVLELTIIVAATFSGFIFGRVFYMRPYRLFKTRLAAATRDAGILLLGLLPWLVIAACIEVFVSPWPFFSPQSKIGIGLLAAVAFWVWTFWPLPHALNDSRIRA